MKEFLSFKRAACEARGWGDFRSFSSSLSSLIFPSAEKMKRHKNQRLWFLALYNFCIPVHCDFLPVRSKVFRLPLWCNRLRIQGFCSCEPDPGNSIYPGWTLPKRNYNELENILSLMVTKIYIALTAHS